MTKYKRSVEDLEGALREQRQFLRSSCQLYDDGEFQEAKRLATTVYLLVQDGMGRTHSLLSQLGLKRGLKFKSSIEPLDKDRLPKIALASITGLPGGRAEILPLCYLTGKKPPIRHLSFNEWWEETIFQQVRWVGGKSSFVTGAVFSRKNLVFHLRSQDGGAHYDGAISNQMYIDFAIAKTIGIYKISDEGKTVPFLNPHLASMRQIAWEVEETLRDIPGGPAIPNPEPWPPKPFRLEGNVEWKPETLTVIPPDWSE